MVLFHPRKNTLTGQIFYLSAVCFFLHIVYLLFEPCYECTPVKTSFANHCPLNLSLYNSNSSVHSSKQPYNFDTPSEKWGSYDGSYCIASTYPYGNPFHQFIDLSTSTLTCRSTSPMLGLLFSVSNPHLYTLNKSTVCTLKDGMLLRKPNPKLCYHQHVYHSRLVQPQCKPKNQREYPITLRVEDERYKPSSEHEKEDKAKRQIEPLGLPQRGDGKSNTEQLLLQHEMLLRSTTRQNKSSSEKEWNQEQEQIIQKEEKVKLQQEQEREQLREDQEKERLKEELLGNHEEQQWKEVPELGKYDQENAWKQKHGNTTEHYVIALLSTPPRAPATHTQDSTVPENMRISNVVPKVSNTVLRVKMDPIQHLPLFSSLPWQNMKRLLQWLWTGNPLDLPLPKKPASKTKATDSHYSKRVVVGSRFPKHMSHQYDFAAYDSGARILASSPSIKNVRAPQRHNSDSYLLAPCNKPIWFVMAFSTQLYIKGISLVSQEFFSSAFHTIEISGSNTYPTVYWRFLALLRAHYDTPQEFFDLTPLCKRLKSPDCWVRYIKFKVVDFYRIDHYRYCTLNRLQVFGSDVLESLDTKLSESQETHNYGDQSGNSTERSSSEQVFMDFHSLEKGTLKDIMTPLFPGTSLHHVNPTYLSASSYTPIVGDDLPDSARIAIGLPKSTLPPSLFTDKVTIHFSPLSRRYQYCVTEQKTVSKRNNITRSLNRMMTMLNTYLNDSTSQRLLINAKDTPDVVTSNESHNHYKCSTIHQFVPHLESFPSSWPFFSVPITTCAAHEHITTSSHRAHLPDALNPPKLVSPTESHQSRSTPPFLLRLVDRVTTLEATSKRIGNITSELVDGYQSILNQLTYLNDHVTLLTAHQNTSLINPDTHPSMSLHNGTRLTGFPGLLVLKLYSIIERLYRDSNFTQLNETVTKGNTVHPPSQFVRHLNYIRCDFQLFLYLRYLQDRLTGVVRLVVTQFAALAFNVKVMLDFVIRIPQCLERLFILRYKRPYPSQRPIASIQTCPYTHYLSFPKDTNSWVSSHNPFATCSGMDNNNTTIIFPYQLMSPSTTPAGGTKLQRTITFVNTILLPLGPSRVILFLSMGLSGFRRLREYFVTLEHGLRKTLTLNNVILFLLLCHLLYLHRKIMWLDAKLRSMTLPTPKIN